MHRNDCILSLLARNEAEGRRTGLTELVGEVSKAGYAIATADLGMAASQLSHWGFKIIEEPSGARFVSL